MEEIGDTNVVIFRQGKRIFLVQLSELNSLEQLLKKFIKNPSLIGISSKLIHNISTCICFGKKYKNRGEIFSCDFCQNILYRARIICVQIYKKSLYNL